MFALQLVILLNIATSFLVVLEMVFGVRSLQAGQCKCLTQLQRAMGVHRMASPHVLHGAQERQC